MSDKKTATKPAPPPSGEEDASLYSLEEEEIPDETEGKRTSYANAGEDTPYFKVDFLHDVPLRLSVELGNTELTLREILGLGTGKVVEFSKVVGEPMDITISGRLMARGEVVVVNERYGVRISEVTRPDETNE